MIEDFVKVLRENQISQRTFAKIILNTHMVSIKFLLKCKQPKRYGTKMMLYYKAIAEWLNDEHRVENYLKAKRDFYKKGADSVDFIYLKRVQSQMLYIKKRDSLDSSDNSENIIKTEAIERPRRAFSSNSLV